MKPTTRDAWQNLVCALLVFSVLIGLSGIIISGRHYSPIDTYINTEIQKQKDAAILYDSTINFLNK